MKKIFLIVAVLCTAFFGCVTHNEEIESRVEKLEKNMDAYFLKERVNSFMNEYLGVNFGDPIELFNENTDYPEIRSFSEDRVRGIPMLKTFGRIDKAWGWFSDGVLVSVHLYKSYDSKAQLDEFFACEKESPILIERYFCNSFTSVGLNKSDRFTRERFLSYAPPYIIAENIHKAVTRDRNEQLYYSFSIRDLVLCGLLDKREKRAEEVTHEKAKEMARVLEAKDRVNEFLARTIGVRLGGETNNSFKVITNGCESVFITQLGRAGFYRRGGNRYEKFDVYSIPLSDKFWYFDNAEGWFVNGKLFYVDIIARFPGKYSYDSCKLEFDKMKNSLLEGFGLSSDCCMSFYSFKDDLRNVCNSPGDFGTHGRPQCYLDGLSISDSSTFGLHRKDGVHIFHLMFFDWKIGRELMLAKNKELRRENANARAQSQSVGEKLPPVSAFRREQEEEMRKRESEVKKHDEKSSEQIRQEELTQIQEGLRRARERRFAEEKGQEKNK